jgi:glycosyltransferase involved in cell wall biosynthesis
LVTLHIDAGREMRGGQWQALYLMRGLAERGHAVRLLAPRGSPLLDTAVASQLEAKPLGRAALFTAVSGVDLIHAHDARAHTLAMLAGRPAIVSRRVAFPVRQSIASRWKYRRAAHFIAVSQFVKQTLLDAGVDEERISVVYDGVPIPPALDIRERSRVVAIDSDDPGKCRKIIEQAAALAGVDVLFSKNLPRDLAGAALFVYITELEGLGSAALLAMANGVPVIASRVGGLPEIVEDGVTGLLTSNQPDAIALQIRRLLADPSLAQQLAVRARCRVEKEFSIERMVQETVRVYERVLDCSKLS